MFKNTRRTRERTKQHWKFLFGKTRDKTRTVVVSKLHLPLDKKKSTHTVKKVTSTWTHALSTSLVDTGGARAQPKKEAAAAAAHHHHRSAAAGSRLSRGTRHLCGSSLTLYRTHKSVYPRVRCRTICNFKRAPMERRTATLLDSASFSWSGF